MTDEVAPTREQCVEWLNAMIEMRAPDLPPFMRIDAVPKAILSHLRTPRVEAGDGVREALEAGAEALSRQAATDRKYEAELAKQLDAIVAEVAVALCAKDAEKHAATLRVLADRLASEDGAAVGDKP